MPDLAAPTDPLAAPAPASASAAAPDLAPAPVPAAPARSYWQRTLALTGALLAAWFFVTFVLGWLAPVLRFEFLGWPFPFWLFAQGALVVYVVLVWVYARRMARLDAEHGGAPADRPAPPAR